MTGRALPVPLRQDLPTIGVVSLAHGVSHFGQLLLPPLFPWLVADLRLSNTQLGALVSVYFVVSFVGQAVAGFVVDRLGARRVLFAGVGLLALGAAGLALSPGYWSLLSCMALAGLGNCVFHPVDFSILNGRVSSPRLGHAYAAHGISGNLGWALAPVFTAAIAQATGSWRLALFAAAALIAGVGLLCWFSRDWLAVVPERATGPRRQAGESDFAFLRSAALWSCFLFFLVFAVALGGIQIFGPAAAGALHPMSAAQMAICLSIYMVTAAVGMVIGGHLLRDPGRGVSVAAAGFGLAALLALAIGWGQWPAWAVPVLFGVMGVGAGVAGPSRDLLVKQATPPGATGRVYGVVYSGLDVGMIVAPPIYGALMDAQAHRAVWALVALMLGALILAAANVRRRARVSAPAAA
jgi:MFS family permease